MTKLFLVYGFDVHANCGKNGACCLHQLCWGPYDQYVLEIAELLLDLGADSTISIHEDMKDEGVGVLGSIEWKRGYWVTGDFDEANMFEAWLISLCRARNDSCLMAIISIWKK